MTSSYWRWVIWLRLLSELEETSTKESKKPKSEAKRPSNRSANSFPRGTDNSRRKTWIIRALVFLSTAAFLYLIFGYGNPIQFTLKKITCNSDNSNELTLQGDGNESYTVLSEDKRDASNTYAEKLSSTAHRTIYRITTRDKHWRKIAFNISETQVESKLWAWEFDGCTISKGIKCTKDGENCDCCKAGGECCKDGKCCCCCSEEKACSCSTEGKKCPCCAFSKLLSSAILNPTDPNRITPVSVFFSLLPTLLYLGFFIFMARSAMKGQNMGLYGGGSIFKIGQSLSKTVKSNITFKDVAGIEEEKEELAEIVDYLKNPARYNAMGARTPKGVILYGPPGTGKTLLAKAVSGEADVPFIEVSGASFDDMFVGVGAKRVRELFAKAKKLSPCIIFIDEIDAVAAKRGNKYLSGGGVNDQTINQLLSEMDGFNTMTGIVIIAATNQLDSIDEAILRPGRFDRHIQVTLPDINERVQILKLHAKNKNISSAVDLENVARKTPGFSGAQLENVLNEATLLAVRANKKVIEASEIDEAIDRVIAGPSKKNRKISFNEKKQIAYHEAGHAIAGLYSEGGDVVEKITIVPRGKAAGYVLSAPEKQESFIKRKDELLAMVLTALAGRAAEEIFFGIDKVSSGASNDLYKVTNLVRNMITKFGMSKKLGLMQYEPSEGPENPYKTNYSDKYSKDIDDEINEIINSQYERAKEIIVSNKEEFLLIVETLLLIETIDKNQIDYIHKYKKLPQAAEKMKSKLLKSNQTTDINV